MKKYSQIKIGVLLMIFIMYSNSLQTKSQVSFNQPLVRNSNSGTFLSQIADSDDEISKQDYELTVDYTLTTEDLGALYEAFTNADQDKNQTLVVEELGVYFSDSNISVYGIQLFVNMVDGLYGHQYKDQFIYFDEFTVLHQILLSSWDCQLNWYFKAIDDDSSSYVTEEEWTLAQNAFSDTYYVSFSDVDTDGDDLISYDEFIEAMSSLG